MAAERWGAVLVVGSLWLAGCGPPAATTPTPSGGAAANTAPTAGRWERLPDGPLSPRGWTAATWTGMKVVLVGGTATDGPLPDPDEGCPQDAECEGIEVPHIEHRDGAALDLDAGGWRSLTPVPEDVSIPLALWPTDDGLVGPGARLAGDAWSPLPRHEALVYAPVRWTGEELVAVGWEYALGERGGVGQVVAEELRLGEDAWSQTAWPADPPGLEAIETVWTGEEVVAFVWRTCADGGGDCTATVGWNPATDTWREIAEHSGAAPRSPGWDGEAIIAGGTDGLIRIDPATGARTSLPAPPEPLHGLDPIVRPGAVALVEGEDVAVLDLDAMAWSRAPDLPFVAPANGRAMLWAGEELLVWGGIADQHLAGSADTAEGYLLVSDDDRTPDDADAPAQAPSTDAGPSDPGEPPADARPLPRSGEAAVYECDGNHHPPSVWMREEPLDEVDHSALDDLREQLESVGAEGWFLLSATEESLVVARREQRSPDDAEQRTHDVVAMGQLGEGWAPGWHVVQWSPCTPRLVLDGLGAAELWLDGEPDPAATTLQLLAVEQGCASGRTAEDRIEIVDVVEQPDAVTVILGVRSIPGGAECPSNPPTAVKVPLTTRLGDRPVLDGTELPPRRLEPATNQPG